jgi:hypothetical protein
MAEKSLQVIDMTELICPKAVWDSLGQWDKK